MHAYLPWRRGATHEVEQPDGAGSRALRRGPQGLGQRSAHQREQPSTLLSALGPDDRRRELDRDLEMGDQLIREVEQFLYREARLLDERRFNDWLQLLTHTV